MVSVAPLSHNIDTAKAMPSTDQISLNDGINAQDMSSSTDQSSLNDGMNAQDMSRRTVTRDYIKPI